MPTEPAPAIEEGGIHIQAGATVYVGGDMVARDKITYVDAAAIQWLVLGAQGFLGWLRLAGAAAGLGLLVAVLSRMAFGVESITDSAAVAILHGAVGAFVGALVAWYSPSLPAALLRVTWITGGMVAAEWIYTRLAPISPRAIPAWFGLPILHASLLVALIAGPWLALVTFALVRLLGPGRGRQVNRYWAAEALAIVAGCLAAGLLVALVFGGSLNNARGPVDPSQPAELVESNMTTWTSGAVPNGCVTRAGSDYLLCPQAGRFETHQEGFITLPGWLTLGQAVGILIGLASIIPAALALWVQTLAPNPRYRRPAVVILVGFAASAAIGVALDRVSAGLYGWKAVEAGALSGYERMMSGAPAVGLLWGAFGLVSAFVCSLVYRVAERGRRPGG